MKPIAVISTIAVILIVVAASFGLALSPSAPIVLPDSVANIALYVCPAASNTFDTIAKSLMSFHSGLTIVFFFFFILFLVTLAWAFYQNLISDKFDKKKYDMPLMLGKLLFWATLVIGILLVTPNALRRVSVVGAPGEYVMCESDTPGARAVRYDAVVRAEK